MALILAREVAVMLLIIGIGIASKKWGILDEQSMRQVSNMVLLFILPALIVRALQHEPAPELTAVFLAVAVLTALLHFAGILAASLLFPKRDNDPACGVKRMGVVLSNCGFMGLPLMLAVMGETGRLLVAAYLAVFNCFYWTWAVAQLAGSRRVSVRGFLTNPGVVATAAGLLLFVFSIRLPGFLMGVLDHLSNINMPVSSIVTGVFLAGINVKEMLKDRQIYKIVLWRNLLIPGIFILLFYITRFSTWFPNARLAALTLVIAGGAPSASGCTLMAAKYGADSEYGAKVVAASTVLGVVTLPLLVYVAELVL